MLRFLGTLLNAEANHPNRMSHIGRTRVSLISYGLPGSQRRDMTPTTPVVLARFLSARRYTYVATETTVASKVFHRDERFFARISERRYIAPSAARAS